MQVVCFLNLLNLDHWNKFNDDGVDAEKWHEFALLSDYDNFTTAAGAKAPRKQVGGSSSSSAASSLGSPRSSGKNKYAGGNPVKWWPSPKWQKGKYVLWFNFILALNFIRLQYGKVWVCVRTFKQSKTKSKPRIKLNYNICVD